MAQYDLWRVMLHCDIWFVSWFIATHDSCHASLRHITLAAVHCDMINSPLKRIWFNFHRFDVQVKDFNRMDVLWQPRPSILLSRSCLTHTAVHSVLIWVLTVPSDWKTSITKDFYGKGVNYVKVFIGIPLGECCC